MDQIRNIVQKKKEGDDSMITKKKIAFDIDGTIADTHSFMKLYFHEKYNFDIDPNKYMIEIPGISHWDIQDDILNILKRHFLNIKPYEKTEYLYNFQEITKDEIFLLTARNDQTRYSTIRWFEYYFPNLKFQLHFSKSSEKGKFLKEKNIDFLVDDRIKSINGACQYLDKAYLLNRIWNLNRDVEDETVVIRCDNLEEIYNDYMMCK